MSIPTKVYTTIWSAVTLTASSSNTTSSIIDIPGSHTGQLNISLTNGATGPTVAAQVQIQGYNDSGHTVVTNFGGALVGSTSNSAVTSWSITLPAATYAVVLVAGSNTGQNVTVSADLSTVRPL